MRTASITQDALTPSSIMDILGISMMRRFVSRMKTTLKKCGKSQGIRLPSLWANSYFVSTVGGTPLSVIKQCI